MLEKSMFDALLLEVGNKQCRSFHPDFYKKEWHGMHNGTVKGKPFERSRRNRKTHAERRAEIVLKSGGKK